MKILYLFLVPKIASKFIEQTIFFIHAILNDFISINSPVNVLL